MMEGPGAELASDLDTVMVDSLKALDLIRPIREADVASLDLVYDPASTCISDSALSNQNRMPISWNRLIADVRCSVARRSPARL